MNQTETGIYFLKNEKFLLSVCDQIDIMSGFLDHYISKMVEKIPQSCFDDIKSLISFAAVLVPFMPSDGIIAFTVSLPRKKRKIFALFDMETKKYVARSHSWNAEEFEKNQRLCVQKFSKAQKMNSISMVDCERNDNEPDKIEDLFRKYLNVSEKMRCSFFVKNSQFVLIKAQNEISEELFAELSEKIGLELEKHITIENLSKKHPFFFSCGCNSDKISSMLSNISETDVEYIFENDTEVEIECPRCGITYKIRKNEIRKN